MPDTSSEHNGGLMPGEQPWRLVLPDREVLHGFRRPGGTGCSGVFVHGFRSHCDGEKARRLSATAGGAGCGWLRYDQRGCGLSTGEFRRFTISAAVADLQRVLEALDEPPYILAGSSLGGLIAIHTAIAERQRIAGLLLIAPALRFTDHFIHGQLDAGELQSWHRRGYRWFPDLYDGDCFRLDYAFCADALRYSEPPGKLPCPVQVIHGTRDELLPVEDTRYWVDALECPAKGLEIIDGGDHRLTGWTDVIARRAEQLCNETANSCA